MSDKCILPNHGISLITGLTLAVLVSTLPILPGRAQSPEGATIPIQPPEDTRAEQAYTLGAGDLVRIDSFDTPELKLEERYGVLVDGSLNLPWVGTVSVAGLTLKQASDALSLRYSRFVRKPLITVSLASPRPLKVGVFGEVNRPGSYIISPIGNETLQSSLSTRSASETGSQWPTVTRAIQTAGGIKQAANVRKITVHRPQRTGPDQVIEVDLWKFLRAGEQNQDLALRDGDSISIPTATALDLEEVTELATSNFSPEVIKVGVVGEVVAPGSISIPPNASLNQAVLAAGGFKNGRAQRKVELIRLNPNGTVTRRDISVDFSRGLESDNNPALRNNDIIVVKPNAVAKAGDFLSILASPITGAFGLFRLLGGGN
jgi:polysaccharide biosynthesis/export protein